MARVPASERCGPPSCTAKSLGGPYAKAGSWQVAQDMVPDADSVSSKKMCFPTCALRLSSGACA